MTKKEIIKYFKQKKLYPYFVTLINQEIFFMKELGHSLGYVPNMDVQHTILENVIRDKHDIEQLEKNILRLKKKGWFFPEELISWTMGRCYERLHTQT